MRYVAARNLWISGNLLSNIAERILRKKEDTTFVDNTIFTFNLQTIDLHNI